MAAVRSRGIAKAISLRDQQSVVTSITSLLKTLDPQIPGASSDAISPEPLNQFSRHLSPSLVIRVVKNQTNPYHALFFFNWASNANPSSYSHTHLCFVAIADLLAEHSLFSAASSLLLRHNRLRDFVIGRFVKAHGDRGDIRAAIHWFRRAKEIENGRCLFSYNAILGVLVKSRRINLARAVYRQIVDEGLVKPDVYTYTMMIRGLCNAGLLGDAQKLFDEMHYRPNLVTWNSIIAGYCAKGDMVNAARLFGSMDESTDCFPDTVTYTTLIDGFCKNGKVKEAIELFEEMERRGVKPNGLTYNVMVNGLCSIGEVEAAMSLIEKMRLEGLRDDVVTHTGILKGLCMAGKLEEAVRHLSEMTVIRGIKLDLRAYEVILNEFCRLKKPDESLFLLKEMMERGLSPRASSYNLVLRVLCDIGDLDRAVALLKAMRLMGRAPNFVSFSSVVSGLCRTRGRIVEAEELVASMARLGHDLDASLYGCLLEAYCSDTDLFRAKRVFYEALGNSHVISLESFSVFAKELTSSGNVEEGRVILEDMANNWNVVDLSAYAKVLDELLCK